MTYFTPYVHTFRQRKDLPPRMPERAQERDLPTLSGREINRLLSAAVISERFRHLLLTDAAAALQLGFNGESFSLSGEDKARILAIQASSLQNFTEQLLCPQPSTQEVMQKLEPVPVSMRVGGFLRS